MGEVSTIGLDIAKSVFQVHGVDGTGAVVMRKRVGRSKVLEFFGGLSPCLVGIEACPSAHYWSRELQAIGHTVKLMPPSYVKAYLKGSKNDANDLRGRNATVNAICFDQDAGTTDWPDAAPDPTIAGPTAHDAVECDPRPSGRTRHHRGRGPQWHG